jgi:hypothetical protein
MNNRTMAAILSLPREALLFDLDALYSCLAGVSDRRVGAGNAMEWLVCY